MIRAIVNVFRAPLPIIIYGSQARYEKAPPPAVHSERAPPDRGSAARRVSAEAPIIRPEPEEHDGRLTNREADELGEAAEDGLGYNLFEALYPGWRCVACDGVKNSYNRGWYVTAVLRRRKGSGQQGAAEIGRGSGGGG